MNTADVLPAPRPTRGRRCAAVLFTLIAFASLLCFATYLSAALFLLLSKADPRQATLTSAFHYWRWYSADPRLRKKLIASISASGLGVAVVLPTALAIAARRRRSLHGDARFASPPE